MRRLRLALVCLAVGGLADGVPAQHVHGGPAEGAIPPPARVETLEEPRVPIEVPPVEQARIGLKLGTVTRRSIRHGLRTVGTVAIDERREAHVHTRFNGWIEEIRVSTVGQPVKKGETFCLFYSPELVSIQEEYLAARGRGGVAGEVARAALERLRLMGVPAGALAALERGEKRRPLVPIEAPIDGYVVAKQAVLGMYVMPELRLYHIADLSSVWILATLYEYDLPIVREGDLADVTLTHEPGMRLAGRITYVYPEVSPETRTVRARLEVANPELRLKPGMYVNVSIEKDLGERLTVPEPAVIDTGLRKIVFVKTAENRFEPREVTLGVRAEGVFEVRSGLREGEEVATSANFLIDAESRLQAAIQKGVGGHAGHAH